MPSNLAPVCSVIQILDTIGQIHSSDDDDKVREFGRVLGDMTRFEVNKSTSCVAQPVKIASLIYYKTRHAIRDSAEFSSVTIIVMSLGFTL